MSTERDMAIINAKMSDYVTPDLNISLEHCTRLQKMAVRSWKNGRLALFSKQEAYRRLRRAVREA